MQSRSLLVGAIAALSLTLPGSALSAVPDVSIEADGPVYLDQPASFTVTDDALTPLYQYLVDCPSTGPYVFSGPTTTSDTFTTTFTTPGEHSVCVKVQSGNDFAIDRVPLTDVKDKDPQLPTAAITATPATGAPGTLVTIDASGSVNRVPGALNFTFDVDGDTSNGYEIDNGTNPVLQKVFANAIDTTVGVRIIDRDRGVATARTPLVITAPPVITPPITGPGTGTAAGGLGDGPIGAVTVTLEKNSTLRRFFGGGLEVKLLWGDVFGKAEVTYYQETTKTKTVKGKKKKVVSRKKIVTAKDPTFYGYGSSFTRKAEGKIGLALIKLKSAKIVVAWTVTSKKGDSKTGEVSAVLKRG